MINNTDIFTRLDWLTNKVNRILGALQNGGGGGGGSQTLDQVLATGNTATNKYLKLIDSQGTAELHGNVLSFKTPTNNPLPASSFSYQQSAINTGTTLIALGAGAGAVNQYDGIGITNTINDSRIELSCANLPTINLNSASSVYTNTSITNQSINQIVNGGDFITNLIAGQLEVIDDSSGNTSYYTPNYTSIVNRDFPTNFINYKSTGIYTGWGSSTSEFQVFPTSLHYFTNVSGGATQEWLTIDVTNQLYNFGDTSLSHGLFINGATGNYFLGDISGSPKGLSIDLTYNNYYIGNQDGTNFRVNDVNISSFIVTSFATGGEGGLGLFNNIGRYFLGDWNGIAQPDTYNVYLDVSSSKADSSIRTYMNGLNMGLDFDFNAGRYVINMPNLGSGDAWFGVKVVNIPGGVQGPAIDMTYNILGSPQAFIPTQYSWVRVEVQGTRYWIPLYSDT
jgi:hypothetical protein